MTNDAVESPHGRYLYAATERVEYGPGALRYLPDLLETFKAGRTLLVTTRSLSDSPLLERIRTIASEQIIDVFAGVRQHARAGGVDAVAQLATELNIDSFISFGGGSVIDSVKAASRGVGHSTGRRARHIAVPTTLSAAEFSPLFGVTDDATLEKTSSSVRESTPQGVILDSELTVETPGWLWLSSGMRAVDHAVETVYAPDHQYATDVSALQSIELLWTHLEASAPPDELVHRQYAQLGAWFSFFGIQNVSMGPSHILGRQIGPRYNVPHGYTSAVLLPHVMRHVMAETRDRQALIACAIASTVTSNSAAKAEEAPQLVAQLVQRLGLPSTLRELSVPQRDLKNLSNGNGRYLDILQAAW